mmetsp:Transcript_9436/g.22726  ORF Transcript_9436/g.22726 Transcript_9436/m.22726 type:complete len:214 (+) Transcript_9436:140-781(+)
MSTNRLSFLPAMFTAPATTKERKGKFCRITGILVRSGGPRYPTSAPGSGQRSGMQTELGAPSRRLPPATAQTPLPHGIPSRCLPGGSTHHPFGGPRLGGRPLCAASASARSANTDGRLRTSRTTSASTGTASGTTRGRALRKATTSSGCCQRARLFPLAAPPPRRLGRSSQPSPSGVGWSWRKTAGARRRRRKPHADSALARGAVLAELTILR